MTPPLVLLHAFPFASAQWLPQRCGFEALGIRVLTPDQRGLGSGAADPGPYSLDDAADDVARVLDGHGLERVVLGGLSMGGYVALRFLARHPGRLAGLVLSDTKAGADTEDGRKARAATAAKVRAEGSHVAFEDAKEKLLARTTHEEKPEIVGFCRALAQSRPREGVARATEAMAQRPDSAPDLARARVPLLAIAGEADPITPVAEAEKIAAAVPGARLRTIPRAGHLANLEAPDAWNRAVLAFLWEL